MTFRAVLPIDPARVPRGMYMRLRVETDPEWGSCEIAEEYCTSASPKASVLRDGLSNAIDLMDDEIEWLHARLGDVIEGRRAAKRAEQMARTRALGEMLDSERAR